MTKVNYSSTSPYYTTDQTTEYLQYLDFWNSPVLLASNSDTVYDVTTKYQNRPDLLSYDIYGTTGYWWVFAMRNPDIIKDPIYDLKAGITIYLPSKSSLPSGMK